MQESVIGENSISVVSFSKVIMTKINSAIEAVIDRDSSDHHPLFDHAKVRGATIISVTLAMP